SKSSAGGTGGTMVKFWWRPVLGSGLKPCTQTCVFSRRFTEPDRQFVSGRRSVTSPYAQLFVFDLRLTGVLRIIIYIAT
ncbi:hypothetical protein HAX54_044802, partial [Datura stramonium]|nr:hypothetical protein [Datura stramonium]